MASTDAPLDRTAFSATSFEQAEQDDRAYWISLAPLQRLAALEQMRRLNYDYDPAADRIQRTLEVATRS